MPFEFYNYDEIKAAANCLEIAETLGLQLDRNNRCAATWRGGDNPTAIAINERGYHDFVTEQSGSVIDLVAHVKFNGLIPQAQQWLGQHLHLTPTSFAKPSVERSRYHDLLEEGYRETARYDYTDAAGELIQQVVRLEHDTKHKEFLQCDAHGRWSVKHIEPVLYNLPQITASDWAIVVEGEKDANTLIEWGFPATTNTGGAKKWLEAYSDTLAGKNIVLMPDNDEAGRAHLNLIGKSLAGKAREIRVLCISDQPKGDVTDWRNNEGGSAEKLRQLLKAAPTWTEPRDDEMLLAAAKEANKEPFRNFIPKKVKEGNKTKIEKEPRQLGDLVKEVHTRFLGFPRKIGSVLFDHDRDSRRIEHITSSTGLFAWIALKSNNRVEWARGDSLETKEELFEGVKSVSKRYESISHVPDWPRRDDTYYAHPELPEASDGYKTFEGLIDFFNPASPEYRVLLKTLFCAPLFYRGGIPRPLWIIDSDDGAGTGKTTLAEMVADLYDSTPIQCQRYDLSRGMDELIKRMVSSTGRLARVFLLDNVTGDFRSEELAGLITRASITGKAPYGRGEESRPNNLTYIVTGNSASVDNDLASRAFFIYVKRASLSASWKSSLNAYIRAHRLQIFADMLDILNKGETAQIVPKTRFPEFEASVLYPQCRDRDEYEAVLKILAEVRSDANSEESTAQQIEDIIREKLTEHPLNVQRLEQPIFIQSALLYEWVRDLFPSRTHPYSIIQSVRNLAKNGLLDVIDPYVKRYPNNKKLRSHGVLWSPDGNQDAELIVGLRGKTPFKLTYFADVVTLFDRKHMEESENS